MLKVFSGDRTHNCAGMSRRDFVQIGALGIGGFSLADALRSRADAAQSRKPSNKKSNELSLPVPLLCETTHWMEKDLPVHAIIAN